MDLTPEQKAIGKENFQAAIGSTLTRRDFLQDGITTGVASGSGLGAKYYGYGASINAPLRVGVIGTGDEGSVLLGAINPEYIEVKAIADIRPYNQHRAFHGDHYSESALAVRCGLMAKYGWKTEDEAKKHVNVYGDYKELLENEPDIEAVIIALPLHLHAEAAIAAMRAGKHVLTEKLMGHSVAQCKEMARVAKETKKHLATGHQRHYNILYDNAVKLLSAGVLGDLHYIRAQWHRGNMPGTDSWQQAMPKSVKPDDVQAEKLAKELVSWENKLASVSGAEAEVWAKKVAQKRAQIEDEVLEATVKDYGYEDGEIKDASGKVIYNRPAMEELIRWRLWNRTGGGLMAELGSHQLDAASIFIAAMHEGKKQYPLSVVASACRPIFPADRDTDDHVYCLFDFPAPEYDPKDKLGQHKKISVAYASINGNGFGGYGETVFGTEGTMLLEKEKEALLYRTHYVDDKTKLVARDADDTTGWGEGSPKLSTESDDELSAAIGLQAIHGDISRGYTEEEEHWAWCIRENPDVSDKEIQPHCYPKVAMADAVIALTTNMAAREGRKIEFKKEWFDPESDETPEGVKPDVSRYA